MSIGLMITIAAITLFLFIALVGAKTIVKLINQHPNGQTAANKYVAEFNKSMF